MPAGWAYVDERGRSLAVASPLATPESTSVSSSAGGSSTAAAPQRPQLQHAKGLVDAGATPAQRTLELWQRVSPGMLPMPMAAPRATTAQAFAWPAGLIEPVDTTHHLKRTDFAAYVEARLRHNQRAAAAARK